MGRPRKYSEELRHRAIDEVLERDRKVPEVAKQLGITTPETLRRWVVQARIDRGLVTGPTTEELAEIKALRREMADQQRTIGILKAATTYFAQEADPRARDGPFVDEHRERWPIVVMCRTIGLAERTFHAARTRPPSARSISDELHEVEIRRVWTANYSCYGPRRVYKQLRQGLRRRPARSPGSWPTWACGACNGAVSSSRPRRRHRSQASGPRRAPLCRRPTEPAVARRHHLRVDLAGLALRRVHPRRALPDDRGLAARQPSPNRPRARRARDGALASGPDIPRADPSQRPGFAISQLPLLGPARRGERLRVGRLPR